jgi:hypothetical protein|tara:strand:- start:537 stop:1709 length:1173 start_codon:yes stop_codon:yes gene_type:complete
MKNRAFHFEIKNLLTQFVAAFDDTVISRFDKDRNAKSNIDVRYVFAPKQRVMYDIVNKAQNITLPVVAVNLDSISRDEDRVFNKLTSSFIPTTETENPKSSSRFLMPVPVNLEVSMSILARYMQDVDQIISNFVPYNNPYIILTWKVPDDYGAEYDQEIRSEVLWSGNLSYSTPTDTTFSEKFRITVDTSFTIKGWLFPEEKDTSGNIYQIDNNFIAVDLRNRIYSPLDQQISNKSFIEQGYGALSGYDNSVPTNYSETISVSGVPQFTNIFYTTSGVFEQLRNETSVLSSQTNNFILYGKSLNYSNSLYLSANRLNFFTDFQKVTSAKLDTISAYKLDDSLYNIATDNLVSISLPTSTLSGTGKFTFVTANEAGWASSYQAASSIINLE